MPAEEKTDSIQVHPTLTPYQSWVVKELVDYNKLVAYLTGMSDPIPDGTDVRMAITEAGLANGTLKPVVNREIPLVEAPQAHRLVMEPGVLGKTVLIP